MVAGTDGRVFQFPRNYIITNPIGVKPNPPPPPPGPPRPVKAA
jgi:hypothetical protein